MYYVISKKNCPYCIKAKFFLDHHKIPYNYRNLDDMDSDRKKLWTTLLKEEFGRDTVPLIIDVIGGFDELEGRLENG